MASPCEMPSGVSGFISFHVLPQVEHFTMPNRHYFTFCGSKIFHCAPTLDDTYQPMCYRPFKDWADVGIGPGQPLLAFGQFTFSAPTGRVPRTAPPLALPLGELSSKMTERANLCRLSNIARISPLRLWAHAQIHLSRKERQGDYAALQRAGAIIQHNTKPPAGFRRAVRLLFSRFLFRWVQSQKHETNGKPFHDRSPGF